MAFAEQGIADPCSLQEDADALRKKDKTMTRARCHKIISLHYQSAPVARAIAFPQVARPCAARTESAVPA